MFGLFCERFLTNNYEMYFYAIISVSINNYLLTFVFLFKNRGLYKRINPQTPEWGL